MAREWVSLFTALDFGHPGQRDIAVWNWGGLRVVLDWGGNCLMGGGARKSSLGGGIWVVVVWVLWGIMSPGRLGVCYLEGILGLGFCESLGV